MCRHDRYGQLPRCGAPELARKPKPENQDHGIGSIIAIEGLVELGMTPAEAIVAATKNGAMACNALGQYGTLEVDKSADLVILDADPLADISKHSQDSQGHEGRSTCGHRTAA